MKQKLLLAFCVFGFGTAFAQNSIISPEVYASAGSFDALQNGTSFSWTIGETITETSSQNTSYAILTQGFQQPKWTFSGVGINEFENENGWNIFPNPANDAINIAFTNGSHSRVNIELFDMFGKRAQRLQVEGGFISEQMDVSHVASGNILLRITNDKGEQLKSCIIIKN